ncbi:MULTISPECIES: Bcr/CflA family efflux MFS transporter [Pseudonocardia]|uniref:Bicyclomycin resistance protein n=2 Tax=Pseudonocardia TaxID=1847 RepID=A0A1Y2N9R4_PSEAH|nr:MULTISPECIES: Bcr/CflA family efflux MFS transporter [Pseudonocardia]OSY44215.1 Bicyclomycin resistance protein [Pseudonocardia autotrophica]TDN74055.1 DHA1 family bicyclomycin/chloramphenicol resistance-like MFS transporter [Pseudonocardia autotrophica]BBG04813.1 Bcr/CflA family drug resistance efflux transporter [Pseudonocardia autotrophica]GEC23469.1 Bcr/CflA family drug resistance efflux transporter [Pseudonocardia saturnea]
MTAPPRSFTLTLAVVVGLGPFAIDMYLASLPDIAAEFRAPVWVTQLTLTGYLLVLGLGQLFAGPLTDAVGRRTPLLAGLALFTAGSVAAALAPSMAVLVAARLLQAAGGAVTVVVVNSSVRDRAEGDAATRLYAALMVVVAVAPIIAPAAGGALDGVAGWRAVFVALAVLGALTLFAAVRFLPESLPVAARTPFRPGATLRGYGSLMRDRAFVVPAAAICTVFGFLFAYIGGASYVYRGTYGLGASEFGLLFGATAVAVAVGAGAAHVLADRLAARTNAVLGAALIVAGAIGATVAAVAGLPIWVLAVCFAVALAGLGITEPVLMGAAMNARSDGLGSASAVLGACQFVLGAVGTAAAGAAAAAGPVVWTGLLLGIAVVAALLTLALPRARIPAGDRSHGAA